MPVTQHDQPVYKLICGNANCASDDWTALDEDGRTRFFETQQAAREWGGLNGWDVGDPVLCPADANDALYAREQADEIAAAINYALGTQP